MPRNCNGFKGAHADPHASSPHALVALAGPGERDPPAHFPPGFAWNSTPNPPIACPAALRQVHCIAPPCRVAPPPPVVLFPGEPPIARADARQNDGLTRRRRCIPTPPAHTTIVSTTIASIAAARDSPRVCVRPSARTPVSPAAAHPSLAHARSLLSLPSSSSLPMFPATTSRHSPVLHRFK